jgi:hypothetical protein
VATLARARHEFNNETVFPLEPRAAGDYVANMLIKGNSILSTLTVSAIDPGATVKVTYFEYTTQNAADAGQEIFLDEHVIINDSSSLPAVNKITITRIHSTPRIRLTITGGSATVEVHNTVVMSFASDLDAALVFEGDAFFVDRTKAIPIAGVDPETNLMNIVRVDNGLLQVSSSDEVINKRLYNESIDLSPSPTYTNHINYEVPVGKIFRWVGGFGSSGNWTIWRVTIDGDVYLIQRNDIDEFNVDLSLQRGVTLTAGQVIQVDVRNRNPYNQDGDIETAIYGIEETAL